MWRLQRVGVIDATIERVVELNSNASRDFLHGWLLATGDDDEINRRTKVPVEVLRAYRHLFFDVSVFRDHFDMVDWVRQLADHRGTSLESLQCLRWAVMYGVEAVAYLTGIPVDLDPRQVQAQIMTESHFRGLMGRDAEISSATAREALKHQQMSVTQANLLARIAPPNQGNIALKIKHRELTYPIDYVDTTCPTKAEILH